MPPSIDNIKKLAGLPNTTVGYLLGENDSADLLKDPIMVQRFRDILALKDKEREHVLFALYNLGCEDQRTYVGLNGFRSTNPIPKLRKGLAFVANAERVNGKAKKPFCVPKNATK